MTDPSASSAPKLGIIAGGGTAPGYLIDACRKHNRPFYVICLEGQADKGLAEHEPHVWLHLGAALKLKKLVAEEHIKELVMIGRVRRPSLFELRPDWLALKVVTKIGINLVGDNTLLSGIGKAMEEEGGVRVIGAHQVFADLLTTEGILGRVAITDQDQADITRGITVAEVLGQVDVGQSVIVQAGIVLGVEAIEGTDALIARSATLRREGAGPVLIKIAKPQQDNRYDLPTVGPETIRAMANAGFRGVALEAGRSLLLEREITLQLADEAGLFVVGIELPGAKGPHLNTDS